MTTRGTPSDPVFLVGSERSGSTLLTHMLDHHPQMAWALALEFAVALVPAPGQWPALPDYYDYLDTNRVFQTSGLQIDAGLDYVSLMHDFLAQERARKHKPFAGAAVHRYFDRLPWLFPTCRFIHLVRDPRDVSRSAIGMGFVGNVWRGASWWTSAEEWWDALRVQIDADRRYEVRYEALIREPEATLRALCEFLGVPYASEMLDYPRDTNYAAPDVSLTDQWRRSASELEIRLIEAVVGPLLMQRGYAPSGLAPLRIGSWQRCRLREDDRYRRLRFRVHRQGFYLTAAELMARRLGWRATARRLQKQINAIEIRYLR